MELCKIIDKFIEIYGGTKDDLRIFTSPGRVNLIGEHTDYNGGYVFPAALTMKTTIVARKRNDNKIVMRATDLDVVVEADIDRLEMQKRGYFVGGMDMMYDDTVPHGGGLSSSAAIEVSTAVMFTTFSNEKNGINEEIDMIKMAKISQKAEHNFIGVKCGIMDQFASAMGKKDHAIFLDCKTLDYKYAPINFEGKKLILTNTNKKHALGASKYNERREECERGLEMLKKAMPEKTCLGEISYDEFMQHKNLITDPIVEKRVEHVICECDRVLKSVDALEKGDIVKFGKLMNESHDSLKNLYEVTGDELDTLAYEARKIDGVLGSRMTGAGFGGCTVSIVEDGAVDKFIEEVGKNYTAKTGLTPSFYISEIGDGGHEVK